MVYTGANYRVGFQGYLAYKTQAALLVPPEQIADPSVVAAVTNWVGPCDMPSWEQNDNFRPVQGIGAAKDVAQVPGRRECSIRTRMMIANAGIAEYAVRSHTDPDAAGTVKGLPLLTLETGIDSAFTTAPESPYAWQGLDSLCNTLRFDFAENQPVQADLEFWPIALRDQPSPGNPWSDPPYPDGGILIWQHATWTIAGTDYKPILSRASVSISNDLERVGSRAMLEALGSEPAISRTPYAIVPKLERLQVQYGLHDNPGFGNDDLGAVVLHAEQPGAGAGRNFLTVTIDNNYMTRLGQAQAPANQMLSFSTDTASMAITIATGQTA